MKIRDIQTKTSIKSFSPDELERVFAMSVELADTIEDMFESHTQYSKNFLRTLRKSMKEAEDGKIKRINSLVELN